MCDVGYLSANFGLPRPLCSRVITDVRDRQTEVRQLHCFMPPRKGDNKIQNGDILILAYPGCPGKWPLNERQRHYFYRFYFQFLTGQFFQRSLQVRPGTPKVCLRRLLVWDFLQAVCHSFPPTNNVLDRGGKKIMS